MGQVYRAVDTRNGHIIAIKALTGEKSDDRATQRFLNEASIQSSLNHQNIVSLYDCIQADNNLYILMEYVDGQTLSDLIRQSDGLNNKDSIAIFSAIIHAVAHLHSCGVIHRDLKSDNIKISSNGQVKILDFGISKSKNTANLTVDDSVVGTISYLSPEQLKGNKANVQSDIWALGILLYEMAAGRLPYSASSIPELCELIKRGKYVPLSAAAPGTAPLIVRIVEKCLQQRPEHRFSSVEEIGNELKIGAAHPDLVPARVTFYSRHLISLLVAVALAVVLITGMLTYSQKLKTSQWMSNLLSLISYKLASEATNPSNLTTAIPVNVIEGTAEVYWNNSYEGKTPLIIEAKIDEPFTLVLKQNGFENYQFNGTVTEQTKKSCTSLWMKKKR